MEDPTGWAIRGDGHNPPAATGWIAEIGATRRMRIGIQSAQFSQRPFRWRASKAVSVRRVRSPGHFGLVGIQEFTTEARMELLGMPSISEAEDVHVAVHVHRRCYDNRWPTRFVIGRAASRRYPELCYVTTRLIWLAGERFQAKVLLASVRAEHQAFYRRVFGYRLLCEPRQYPPLVKPICLMGLDYPSARERQRLPFFRSNILERRALFDRPEKVRMANTAAA